MMVKNQGKKQNKEISGQKTLESMSQAVWYNRWLLSQFDKYLKGNILEVGCGIGNFTKLLEQYGQVTATDIENTYLPKVKKLVNKSTLVGLGNIEKNEYFFKGKKFDSIVCLNVLEHIENDNRALGNLYKLLNKNGCLILLVPAHQWLYGEIDKSIDHFRRYDKKGLGEDLKKIGFKIIESKRLNMLGALGWGVVGKVLKNKEVEKGKLGVFNLLAPAYLFSEKFFEPPVGLSVLVVVQR